MARFKDFGTPEKKQNLEPVEFAIYGERFHCVDEIQGAVLLELVAAADGEGAEQAGVLTGILSNVLQEESKARFDALTHSKDKIVPLEYLGEIAGWLIEIYAAGDRPEAEPDQS